uniref:Reverse transcriptase/retrotransposon-derived protein RNase H-like domain-containing protein n=1 Tax=Electrophorus electricus TaxID=8005 RepID=A0A4W4E2W3_ELEEL
MYSPKMPERHVNYCPDTLVWTQPMHHSFRTLKLALYSALPLDLPNYNLTFHLYVSEHGSTAVGILAQEHCGSYRPVAYLSKPFDSMPACLHAVAASALLDTDVEKLVKGHDTTSESDHKVVSSVVSSE